jgi:hypothetical protein
MLGCLISVVAGFFLALLGVFLLWQYGGMGVLFHIISMIQGFNK